MEFAPWSMVGQTIKLIFWCLSTILIQLFTIAMNQLKGKCFICLFFQEAQHLTKYTKTESKKMWSGFG